MSFYKFNHVKVSAISVVVPEHEISIYDEAMYYDNNIKKIDRMRKIVGFFKRRTADEDVTPSDLAIAAANNLFEEQSIEKGSIDALIYVHQKLSYPGPVDAYEIHHKLGLSPDCICTSVLQGCAGWVYGLFLCSQMIERGGIKRILLLNADTPSVGINIKDRNLAPIFGDGGSATFIEFSEEQIESFFGVSTFSSGFDTIISPAGGCRLRYNHNLPPDDPFNAPLVDKFTSKAGYLTRLMAGHMDGDAVFEFTMNKVPEQIKSVLSFSGYKHSDIAKCCLHQANKQIVQTVACAAGFSIEDAPCSVFENYGNNTMCSIPSVLSEILSKEESKLETKPYLCSGFGNGLVVATAILDLKNTYSSGIKNFEKDADFKTRSQWIDYWKSKVAGKI